MKTRTKWILSCTAASLLLVVAVFVGGVVWVMNDVGKVMDAIAQGVIDAPGKGIEEFFKVRRNE